MEYLPIFIDLKNRPVLVVGGGSVAARKIKMLHRAGATITIVAPALCRELKNTLITHKIHWINKDFHPMMLDRVILVIVATNNSKLNTVIYQNAEKRHLLVNTVDDKNKCSCIFPAIVDRDPILIGISSFGKAPILVRILREKLELLLPKSLGFLAKLAGAWRNRVKQHIVDTVLRRQFWEKIFYHGQVAALIEQGRPKEAKKVLKYTLNNSRNNKSDKKGHVVLVGAGPGDIGLLTIRGLQVMQQADIILYDYLVNSDILDLARRDADKICVGKHVGNHSISQKELNQFMVQLAQKGNKVVRLKGGDPFIFGRGGEELQAISEAGIKFQVVPGITAGIGVAAYSGIPLTHRKFARSVIFITGHNTNDHNDQFNWNSLSNNKQTLVIYMGKLNAINIRNNLIIHGRNIHTPIAVISKGTYQDQKILIGTLIELEKLAQMADNPALLIVGDVVLLHNQINWFGQKALNYYPINSIINLI
ncbi:siroheme synthase CysG [Blochmannia endosymbiont of Camponotus sp. C-003]|uniref:siroheme synthase CysG n=1 Tax=unclassified Candidatus Blochmanniella TaxID=711328 RepID=UPI002025594E|nr:MULTISPECIES: siroheme synthase CysG [unclassified Candidatus Blochmannia]URJ23599.1 siroheme synthase CysG [Blochmannia endosymbiont of Camponotus sp. C-003]URJ29045.1 siroheme synthase CysG [Blochmannia endosymbiont of Camponotus sp. C-046]